MMAIPREILHYICAGMAAAAFILILIRRAVRSIEARVAIGEAAAVLVTVACFIWAGAAGKAPPDVLTALLLAELGVCALIYDHYRTFRSISGTLRNMGSMYIFAGLVCMLSRTTGFPVLLWAVPVVLFCLGYFFLRRRHGIGNLCKGLGVLISVGFIASMMYDVREGTISSRRAGTFRDRFLPDIMKPSIVEDLNALNEKMIALQGEKKRLTAELLRAQRDCRDLGRRTERAEAAMKDAEGILSAEASARAAAEESVKRLNSEKAALDEALRKESAGRAEAEQKMSELAKAKTAAKDSFTTIEEKLSRAAEDLKRAVAERDGMKAELEALKSAMGRKGAPAAGEEIEKLRRQIAEKEAENLKLTAENGQLKEALERVREAVGPAPAK